MVRVTVTVIGFPTEGVITTVEVCVPALKPVTLIVNVTGEDCPAASLPLDGDTVNQVFEGVPAVQVNVLPPRF